MGASETQGTRQTYCAGRGSPMLALRQTHCTTRKLRPWARRSQLIRRLGGRHESHAGATTTTSLTGSLAALLAAPLRELYAVLLRAGVIVAED